MMNNTTISDTDLLDNDGIIYLSNDTSDSHTVTGACFIIIFIVSIIGNILLLCVLVSYEDLRNSTNLIVLNLACSDLVFSLILPFWATYTLHHWVFGDFWCKFSTAAYFTGLYSSIILLTVLTVDRFVTVVLQYWTENNAKRYSCTVSACVAAWVISIPASLSDALKMIAETQWNGDTTCDRSSDDTVDRVGDYLQISLLFFLPLSIILFCYFAILKTILQSLKGRKLRSVMVVLCIIAAFIICWGPYNIMLLVEVLYEDQDFSSMMHFETAAQVCKIVAYSHCCMNPLLYMLSQKMRKHLMALLRFDKVCRKKVTATAPTTHIAMTQCSRELC